MAEKLQEEIEKIKQTHKGNDLLAIIQQQAQFMNILISLAEMEKQEIFREVEQAINKSSVKHVGEDRKWAK